MRAAVAQACDRNVDEPSLIAGVLAGDRVAGRTLYDVHAPRVYRLVFRLVGDEELARECTQETFIRAFERLGSFRGDAALATWLHRIAVSVTLNAMRRWKRFRQREIELDEADEHPAPGIDADPDLKTRLHAAINSLAEIYRTVVVLHDVEDYTHGEIAQMLGIPEGTSKARLSTARAKLRESLADFAKE
jgi:RNA polymerase sigma-70 factor (ECF subfamily)